MLPKWRGAVNGGGDLRGSDVNKANIPSLDGLRAISIILVMVGHAIRNGPHPLWFRALFLHAELGVRVFFIISGFLITTLLLDERSQYGSISLGRFYVRRALRILPAFFLFIGLVALLSIVGIVPVPGWYWSYVLTYTVNFAPFAAGVWALAHLWSLSVEEQFYLLWPLLVRTGKRKTCVTLAVLAIFANPVGHGIQHSFGGLHLPYYAFPFVCGPIATGCLMAMGTRQLQSFIISSKLLSDRRALVFTLIVIALFDAIPPGLPAFFIGMVTTLLLTFCVARVVFIPAGLAGHILNSAPLVLIGKLSYSLYLWQQLFLSPGLSPPVATPFPINFASIFAAASASYWGLEVRFLGLRKKFRKLATRPRSAATINPGPNHPLYSDQ